MASPRHTDLIDCALLSAIWLLLVLFVGVHGEFPLNDDWAYSIPTRNFVQTGTFARLSWTWTPILSHVAIGAVFAKLFGFSLVTMRMVGVVMGWAGMIGAYVLCRRARMTRVEALLATGCVAWNPLYVNLSFTYMLDVPIAAMVTWSLALLLIGLRSPVAGIAPTEVSYNLKRVARIAALGLAAAATASRQTNVALIVAMTAALALTHMRRLWHLGAALALLGVLLGLDKIFDRGLFSSADRGASAGIVYMLGVMRNPGLLRVMAFNGVSLLIYIGLFISPLILLLVKWKDPVAQRMLAVSVTVASAVFAALPRLGWKYLPAGINIITERGIGPVMLDASEVCDAWSQAIWAGLTLFALWSIFYALSIMAVSCFRMRAELRNSPYWITLLLFPPIYIFPHVLHAPCFDRYLLPLMPAFVVCIMAMPDRPVHTQPSRVIWAAAAVIFGLTYSALGTRDYMQRNRAVWSLLQAPLASGVPREEIDGGFEYRGWYRFEGPSELKSMTLLEDHRNREHYIVSFHDRIDGYKPIAQRRYFVWLQRGYEAVTLHERLPAVASVR